jgi:hypothetical protein
MGSQPSSLQPCQPSTRIADDKQRRHEEMNDEINEEMNDEINEEMNEEMNEQRKHFVFKMSEKTSGETSSQRIKSSGGYKRGDLNKRTLEELRVISRNIGLNAEYVLQGVAKKKKKEALIACIISY